MKLGFLVVLAVAVLVPSLSESRIVSKCELKDQLSKAIKLSARLEKHRETILERVIYSLYRKSRLNTGLVRVFGKRVTTTTAKPTPEATTPSTPEGNETTTEEMTGPTDRPVTNESVTVKPMTTNSPNGTNRVEGRQKREASEGSGMEENVEETVNEEDSIEASEYQISDIDEVNEDEGEVSEEGGEGDEGKGEVGDEGVVEGSEEEEEEVVDEGVVEGEEEEEEVGDEGVVEGNEEEEEEEVGDKEVVEGDEEEEEVGDEGVVEGEEEEEEVGDEGVVEGEEEEVGDEGVVEGDDEEEEVGDEGVVEGEEEEEEVGDEGLVEGEEEEEEVGGEEIEEGSEEEAVEEEEEVEEIMDNNEGGKREKRSFRLKRKWPLKRRPWSIGFYGLFQLSDSYFCDSGYRWSTNRCKTSCTAFTDDDISDDIACLVKTRRWWNLMRKARWYKRAKGFLKDCN